MLLGALLIPTIVCAADFSGRVVEVIDGDTIEVLHHGQAERICLSGIDCQTNSTPSPLVPCALLRHTPTIRSLQCLSALLGPPLSVAFPT